MIHNAPWHRLPHDVLHDLLKLRVEVFVVEQNCAYAELDGRDNEVHTLHVWSQQGDAVDGYLRILHEANGERRIGRVCVAAHSRGRGVAAELMKYALNLVGDAPVVLAAQSHLVEWYARFGFEADGPEFLEDGIPHTPMRLTL